MDLDYLYQMTRAKSKIFLQLQQDYWQNLFGLHFGKKHWEGLKILIKIITIFKDFTNPDKVNNINNDFTKTEQNVKETR